MVLVTISSDFRIVIPREIRDELNLVRGQRLLVAVRDGRIELTRAEAPFVARGYLRGIDSKVPRERDRD